MSRQSVIVYVIASYINRIEEEDDDIGDADESENIAQ